MIGMEGVSADWLVGPLAAQTSAAVAVPVPSPSPSLGELDPNDVSPGLLGFAVMFGVVLLCIPLFRSMTGKIRRVEHRAEVADDAGDSPSDQAPGAP